ncbi:MAG: AbrB/MazE/SpoVT family DNA-binding domain-containing protein [Candidatus Hydrogenedentes bacterium]|nr:AbrB/MazE/SpoVT family DNA-binding domain-containing protein [Candidatus Hydrogenedentota bacterium]
MKARIIKIGNSKGLRIPKALLEQAELSEEVLIQPREGGLIIRAVKRPRQGWVEAFRRALDSDEDRRLSQEMSFPNKWDEAEWRW